MAVRADFIVTNQNAPAIAEICARLDGLPLAIELAVARIRLLSPEAMLSRLGHRLQLLTGGARNLPARQQTLRDTIAWSHDLLDDAERRLFRRLAVFVGGWSLEAERDDVRAALAWSQEPAADPEIGLRLAERLWQFWYQRGYAREGRDWLATTLRTAPAPTRVRADALLQLSMIAIVLGDEAFATAWAEGRALSYEEAVAVALAEGGDP